VSVAIRLNSKPHAADVHHQRIAEAFKLRGPAKLSIVGLSDPLAKKIVRLQKASQNVTVEYSLESLALSGCSYFRHDVDLQIVSD